MTYNQWYVFSTKNRILGYFICQMGKKVLKTLEGIFNFIIFALSNNK